MSYKYINLDSCFITGIALSIIMLLIVAVRIVLRCRVASKVMDTVWSKHLDDLFCLLAVIPTAGVSAVLIYGAKKGVIGGHNDATHSNDWITSTTPDYVILEKLVYIIFIIQPVALGFTRLAVIFFYRRIFVFSGLQRTSLVFILLTVGWMLAFLFGFIFDCRLNFSANWGSLATIGENCPFGFEPTIVYTITDSVFDVFLLILPLPWIWKLQMPTVRKLQVVGVFMLGGFAVAASLVRMVICIEQNTPSNATEQEYIMGMPTYDIIGITSHGLFWTAVETNVALIACCLPILKPLFSMTTFGVALASFGSLLQAFGSTMGSQNGTKNGSTYLSSGNGAFHKNSVRSDSSLQPKRGKDHDIRALSDTASDIELIDIEKGSQEAYITCEPGSL